MGPVATEVGAPRRRTKTLLALGVFLVAVLAVGGWRTSTRAERGTASQPTQRLERLERALGSALTPPPDAELISRSEFVGDNVSDGPGITWRYRFGGTPEQFAQHYRETLPALGWVEEAPGDLLGQITNFRKVVDGKRFLVVVFGPGTTPDFRVDAYG